MFMFGTIYKNSYFLRLTVKNASLTCLVLRAGPIRTRNQDPRPLLDSFQHHEVDGGLRFCKRAFIKNHIFDVS